MGSWIAIIIGAMISSSIFCYLYCRIDLKEMKREALQRVGKEENKSTKASNLCLITSFHKEMDDLNFPKKRNYMNIVYNDEL